MKYRKEIILLLSFSLSGILFFSILLFISWLNKNIGLKIFDKLENFLIIYFMLSFVLLIPSLFLFIVKSAVYRSWRLFAIIFFPISLLLIASAPEYCGAIVCLLTREAVTLYMSILFLIISLCIIAIKSWKLRGKPDIKVD